MTNGQLLRRTAGNCMSMILVFLFAIASVVVGATFIARAVRSRITPRELRGDWWARFESEFRDYTKRSASAGHARRRPHGTPPR